MWWILIALIVIFCYIKYVNDRNRLRNSVVINGGMGDVFKDFVAKISEEFAESKILKMTDTELEIMAVSMDQQVFIFGIRVGFSGLVNYRCDHQRSNFINAQFAVQGSASNQVACYKMLIDNLRLQHDFRLSGE